MTRAELTRQVLELPIEDQLELAQTVWEQSSPPALGLLSPELEAELDRRLAEAIAHPETSIPWDDVKRRLWPDL